MTIERLDIQRAGQSAVSRRGFLRTAIASAAAGRFGLMSARAAGEEYRALVCVFLFGGNDSSNVIVPLSAAAYRSYAAGRGGLALAQASLLPITAPGGEAYGLHPRLGDLQQLFSRKQLAFVANVGMLVRPMSRDEYRRRAAPLPVNLFSHSDQQMQWQCSAPDGNARTGWAGRAADKLLGANQDTSMTGVSLAGNTLFLIGREARPALVNPGAPTGLTSFNDTPASQARLRGFQELLTSDSGFFLVQVAGAITAEGIRASRLLSSVLAGPGLNTRFPATTLGRQLEQVARLIKARGQLGVNRQIFFCSLGGWDTHISQLASHDSLLGQLGPALAAFHAATEELGVAAQVTTFTESEFGRTLQPSSGAGSDHGWGSHHFVIGGAVKGGEIYGQFPTVAIGGPDDATNRGVWVPSLSLDQYGATLASWFGVSDSDRAEVFPNLVNFAPAKLGFMG